MYVMWDGWIMRSLDERLPFCKKGCGRRTDSWDKICRICKKLGLEFQN